MPNVFCRMLVPGDEKLIESFLDNYLSSSIFLVANMRESGLLDTGERVSGTYLGVFEGEILRGCLAHFWNGNIILQAPNHLELLLGYLIERLPRGVRGVIGPGGQVASALTILQIPSELKQLDEKEGLYELELSKLKQPKGIADGSLIGRRIEQRDIEQLTPWSYEYRIEALGEEPSQALMDSARLDVLRRLELRRGWVLEQAGRQVATSAFNAAIDSVVQVGGVYTPPSLRGQGFGRSVVAASLRDAAQDGAKKGILFTGETNAAAVRAYESLGFREIGDYRLCLLKEEWWPKS